MTVHRRFLLDQIGLMSLDLSQEEVEWSEDLRAALGFTPEDVEMAARVGFRCEVLPDHNIITVTRRWNGEWRTVLATMCPGNSGWSLMETATCGVPPTKQRAAIMAVLAKAPRVVEDETS